MLNNRNRRNFNRQIGVVFINVDMSNPNGDFDAGGAPRVLPDGRGWISPASMKAKYRAMLADHNNPLWSWIVANNQISEEDRFFIFESMLRGYDVQNPLEAIDKIKAMVKEKGSIALLDRFWDDRVFGTTALEKYKGESISEDEQNASGVEAASDQIPVETVKAKKSKKIPGKGVNREKEGCINFVRTGCVQLSPAVSLLPVSVIEGTLTKRHSLRAELAKDSLTDVAPLSFKVVQHGLYMFTYRINPVDAFKTNTSKEDIDMFKFLVPHLYKFALAANRSNVDIVAAYHAEHSTIACSFNELEFISACKPKIITKDAYSNKLEDYKFKTIDELKEQFPSVVELMQTSLQTVDSDESQPDYK